MANILDKYENATSEVTVPAAGVTDEDWQTILKELKKMRKKDRKAKKTLRKALRRQNKLLEEEVARRKAAEKSAAETDKGQGDNGMRRFLSKLGDAVCKAIPKVLTTVVTLAFGFFVKTKFAGKAQ